LASLAMFNMGVGGLSRVIKVKYRGGVLVPEEPLDLEEDKEFIVKIIDVEKRKRVLEKYRGILGRVDQEVLDDAIEEAEHL
jgi:predicted DNA-binding antitoxin AbrB/MazE fold protein